MKWWMIFGLILLTVLVLGAGCKKAAESPCPANYIQVNNVCCSDYDSNGVCDSEQVTGAGEQPTEGQTTEQPPAQTEEQVTEEAVQETVQSGYVWDNSKIKVTGYVCGNNSISINLQNTLTSRATIYKIRLGDSLGKGLPASFSPGEIKSIDVRNTLLKEQQPIGLDLFIEYKDWGAKQTRYLGPSRLEGDCK